jgi:hypothetical protein
MEETNNNHQENNKDHDINGPADDNEEKSKKKRKREKKNKKEEKREDQFVHDCLTIEWARQAKGLYLVERNVFPIRKQEKCTCERCKSVWEVDEGFLDWEPSKTDAGRYAGYTFWCCLVCFKQNVFRTTKEVHESIADRYYYRSRIDEPYSDVISSLQDIKTAINNITIPQMDIDSLRNVLERISANIQFK